MPVYKDEKRNTWYFRTYVEDYDGTIKQKSKSGFATKKIAKEEEQKLIDKYNSNFNDITFQELYNVYIKHQEQALKPKSFSTYKSIFKLYILPFFSSYRLSKITNREYLEFKEKILKKGFSYKYNSSIHICMVSILNYAIDFYGLEKNIASKVGNFSKKDYIPKTDFWTFEEFLKFISVVNEIEYHTLFTVLYYTGVRIGECLALTWNDFRNDYLDINKTFTRSEESNYVLGPPKTFSSRRKISLDNYTIKKLNELKKHYQSFVNFNDNWYIFGGIKPLARTTITTNKNIYCKKANVKEITLHNFRHSHASLLISQRVPLTVIQKRLGHKDLSTTLNKYSHMIPEDEDKAINAVNFLNNERILRKNAIKGN